MEEKIKCRKCGREIEREAFLLNLRVCPYCNDHTILGSMDRILITADEGSFREFSRDMKSVDFLKFFDLKSYKERLMEAKLKTGLNEAIVTGEAKIGGHPVALGVMDFGFMGGSMGSVVGEKIRRLCDFSIKKVVPLIIFASSGGARMQEGIMSLMQMAKTVSAVNRVREKKIPYFCIITYPTSGGVSASFATIADIIISEPGALFCFAGPRVVSQTIKKEIPPDFGLAERNLKNGQVDMIAGRKEIRDTLARLIRLFSS
ncbi:MAG: acetyl-CoA carboxylase carboxyl transferase subunit beta [Actinobacteria bacterium]|nr:acetyl-CoA carboxylase carboxyl transferase subunit beta [Actinomycetota bacterium]